MATGTTLVTGATGFVGSHLLDRLVDHAPLIAWYRPGGKSPDNTRPLDWRAVDILDPGGVAQAVADAAPEWIYHLAGAPQVASSWRNAVPHLRTNVMGTHYLLEAARRLSRPCRILIVSSAQVYRPSDDPIDENAPLTPSNPYGFSKLAQDQLALRAAVEDDLDVVVARPFNHAGPGQAAVFAVSSFARQIARIEVGLEPPTTYVGNLEARRDLTDVRDVADAYTRLMARGTSGRAYNVCSGSAWRIGDLLEEMLQMARCHIEIVVDPERVRPNDIPVLQGDAGRLRSELGWAPRIPVEQTLSDTLEYWRTKVRSGR